MNNITLQGNKIEGVIFDLDGVLVDTEYFQWQGWVEVLKPFEKSLSKEEYFKYAGKQGSDIESALIIDLNLPLSKNTLLEKKEKLLINWFETKTLECMPFAKEAVEYFHHKNLKLACASGGPRNEVELKLQKKGLFPLFQEVVSGTDVERGKPFPDIYLLATEKLGLKPEQCLAFEDTQYGVAAAKAAGLTCFAIPSEYSSQQDFSEADGVFGNLQEAVSFLSKNK